MKIQYYLTGINNFHNRNSINLFISGERAIGMSGTVYRISRGQARRIADHFCGVTDCKCAHGAVEILNEDETEFGISVSNCDIIS